jgi:hypothetical protein
MQRRAEPANRLSAVRKRIRGETLTAMTSPSATERTAAAAAVVNCIHRHWGLADLSTGRPPLPWSPSRVVNETAERLGLGASCPGLCRTRRSPVNRTALQSTVTVSPAVVIVTVLALLILALVALLRARPDDIPKVVRQLTRWFTK